MLYNIDDEIRALGFQITAGNMAAYRIEDNQARRALTRAPLLKTDADKLKAQRRAYDAVKRAKLERARVAKLVEIRAQLIVRRDELDAAAALL